MPIDDRVLSELQTNGIAESSPQIPIIIVGPAPQKRLHPHGWYARGFTATAGILSAIALFGLAIVLLLAGGLYYLINNTSHRTSEITIHAKRMALPELRKKGVVAVADDAIAIPYEGDIVFAGKGTDTKGKLCQFAVRWKVATFNGEQKWEWVLISVNGDESRYK